MVIAAACTAALAGPATPAMAAEVKLARAAASPNKLFLDAKRPTRFELKLEGNRTRDLVIQAVKVSSGDLVRRWRRNGVEPGETRRVRWDGRRAGGTYTGQGRHVFRVREVGGGKVDASDARGTKRVRFFKHRFPLRGRHSYGDGFGAGRGHQGQDLFGDCGNRVVAARGGTVQISKFGSSAGYYIVIDGARTRRDYVYMHLQRRGRPAVGDRVKTGEVIGFNGQTGNARGCHLHFELWSAPGWYEGGRATPPTRPLRSWDRWS